MNRIENFHRMMRRQGASRLPLQISVTAPVLDEIERRTGHRDVIEAFDLDFDGMGPAFPDESDRWRAAFQEIDFALPPRAEVGFAGISFGVPPADDVGQAYHLRQWLSPLSVITSVNQLQKLPWPNLDDPAVYAPFAPAVQRMHAQNHVACGHCACTIFEHSWYLRGMDVLFGDLIEGNDIGAWLLDWFTRRSIRVVSEYARAGVDCIWLGDDVGTQRGMMMAVDFWRRHLKTRLAGVVRAIRQNQTRPIVVNYHSDGDVRDIIDDLVEIGIDSLNPIQPECMPPRDIIPANQRRLSFWGMIGTQTTMPFGTAADVRRAVAELAELARRGAGIVVAPTHVLEPEVPWENIQALVQAVREARL